ncbi:hypothetical protein ACVW0I_000709 [Bradyrhizobium sp. LM6.11]
MSSTPSMSWIRRVWSAGLHGAKPTPQLPMIAVVTPFCEDGVMSWLQVTWPS